MFPRLSGTPMHVGPSSQALRAWLNSDCPCGTGAGRRHLMFPRPSGMRMNVGPSSQALRAWLKSGCPFETKASGKTKHGSGCGRRGNLPKRRGMVTIELSDVMSSCHRPGGTREISQGRSPWTEDNPHSPSAPAGAPEPLVTYGSRRIWRRRAWRIRFFRLIAAVRAVPTCRLQRATGSHSNFLHFWLSAPLRLRASASLR
jgi:hypothetical protein